jgi:hypothetical protein
VRCTAHEGRPPAGLSAARPGGGLRRVGLLVLATTGLAGCGAGEAVGPAPREGPPYLVVVTRTRTPVGITVTTPYEYRVEELSQSLNIDTTLIAAPSDTILLSVPPASYQVTLKGLPPKCRVQGDSAQSVVIPEGTNTALLRFLVICEAQVFLENLTEGQGIDPEFIYRVRDAGGIERVGLIRANDTLLLDGFTPGSHTLLLTHVASNCQVVSDGGNQIDLQIQATGTTNLALRVACSDPAQQPELLSVAGSYHGGVSGFVFTARDPDKDIERFVWDLTDCHRRSVLQQGGRIRSGLSVSRIARQDTVVILGAYEVGAPDTDMQSRCVAIRVVDQYGNSSELVQAPLSGETGEPPFVLSFNASLLGTQVIRTSVAASDPEDDFLGIFAAARLRDGVLGPADGKPDFGVFNPVGYLGSALPDLPLGDGRPPYTDYYSIILFLFDQRGNFRRVEDLDLFR